MNPKFIMKNTKEKKLIFQREASMPYKLKCKKEKRKKHTKTKKTPNSKLLSSASSFPAHLIQVNQIPSGFYFPFVVTELEPSVT